MTAGATMRRVARPRGALSKEQQRRIQRAFSKQAEAERAYRAEVLAAMAEGASFAEMSTFTGLSTNTLQRWKREAGK